MGVVIYCVVYVSHSYPEDVGSIYLRNFINLLPEYMLSWLKDRNLYFHRREYIKPHPEMMLMWLTKKIDSPHGLVAGRYHIAAV
jgi:hypothetical protein